MYYSNGYLEVPAGSSTSVDGKWIDIDLLSTQDYAQ